MPDNNRSKRSDCTVEAAREGRYGLQVKIDGRWTYVVSKPQFLDRGMCILEGSATSGSHFDETHEVFYLSNSDDHCAAWMIKGGTDSPVVAMLMEDWAAQPNRPPGLSIKRHHRNGLGHADCLRDVRGDDFRLQCCRHGHGDEANAASLIFSAVQVADSGTYTVTVSNAAGCVISSTVTLLVQTTYANWEADHFSAQEIAHGFASDNYIFSGDGVPNLLKYALDFDPRGHAAGSALATVSRSGADGLLQISFVRDAGATDIVYLVEVSPDLLAWTTIAQGNTGASATGIGAASVTETALPGTNQYQVTVKAAPPSGGSQFLRMRIVRP